MAVVEHNRSFEPPKLRIRIGTALNTYSVAIAVLPVVIVILITSTLFRNQAEEQTFNQMTSIAESRQQEITRWLENAQIRLNVVLANSLQVRDMRTIVDNPLPTRLNDSVRVFLQNQIDVQGSFTELFIYDLDGDVRLATSGAEVARVAELGYFEPSLTAPHIEPPTMNPDTNQLELIVTSPIYRTDGGTDVVGVLAGRLSLDELAEIMAPSIGFGETGESYIVNADSHLVTPLRNLDRAPGSPIGSTGITSAIDGEDGQDSYKNYLGRNVIGVYRYLPQLNAALIGEIESQEAFTAINQVRTISLVIALIAALIAFIIGQGVTRWLVWPIRKLTTVARAVMRGDYSQRAGLALVTEIGQLGRAFDTMTDNLVQTLNERNERLKEIQRLSGTLEQRVTERTRDLRVAAELSKQITTVLDIDELLRQVATLTAQSFGYYRCNVYRANEEAKTLTLAACSDEHGKIIPDAVTIPISLGRIPGEAAIKRGAVQISATSADPAKIAIPMMLGDILLGVFEVQSRIPFSPEELNLVTTLAEQTAIALRNAQLYADAQKARAEAEEASRVKSQFLANMSHELRTPLNAILNFAEFMADGDLGEVTEEQVDALNKVITSGEHLLSLINDVLDITKIEVGLLELFIEDVDLNTSLKSVVSTGKGLLKDRPVQLVTEIEEGLPIIRGDRRRLHQVFLNLLSNAVKFTPEGSITLRAKREGQDDIHISVADTGVGIAAHELDLVFESFRQAEHGRQQSSGTGLGLPISKHFVEKHGGRIWLESELGKGTTFHVILPIRTVIEDEPSVEGV